MNGSQTRPQHTGAVAALVPRPTSAFRVGVAPDGARATPTLSTHLSGLGPFSVPDVQQPGTEFRAIVLAGYFERRSEVYSRCSRFIGVKAPPTNPRQK
jgi:hypothetical protein